MRWFTVTQASRATGLTITYIQMLLRSGRIEGAGKDSKGKWMVPGSWVRGRRGVGA